MSRSESISTLFPLFDPIALEDMATAKLMDRVDSKFIFHLNDLNSILAQCPRDYSLVTIQQKPFSSYETIYYDTSNFDLYHQHHSGKLNRYKIRIRRYTESNVCFLEIKFKNNKGRTEKNRIKLETFALNQAAFDFIEHETNLKANELVPSIQINYNRITLVNKLLPERVTIDVNLEMINDSKNHSFTNLVIAEVKQDKLSNTKFIELMKVFHVKEAAISKYCLGISNLVPNVKRNNFRESNYNINKLITA